MTTREVEHETTIHAPAAAVYRLLAEVANWPRIFPPTIYADREECGAGQERIRIWATANGEPKTWTSRRTLDAEALRITFRQEVTAPPVAAMGGTWIVEPMTGDTSRVRLLHDYRAVDDDPHDLLWIERAVDENSTAELAALKENVERDHAAQAQELTFSFTDTVTIDGSAKDAFDFVNEAGLWPERLPHVARVRFTEDTPGLQELQMDTRAKDGSTHTTKSYRVAIGHHRIAYKQVTLPALMTLHTGVWTFKDTDDGAAVASSQHTVTLNTDNIARILGPEATVADARAYVHGALSTNSLATLGHAKDHAERMR
ncbi:actinorhodin polyketide synthase bifunctional cyclase/dehydratase [Streptomyces spiralis]|uniref:Actinorhodin polyketide synthase bifunctional cyclase/dehydratase n=1 Tax=Streptomyces spiralis TaxID=66376 RepID=A0A919AF64_9ACTN|nr:aromatase/cyclase [Streptomyces spiralis]GHF02184.1 actinorhodin polyketide synthase bifunctional cyclase/dehydratase [Streptomyces spiralis]